MSKRTKRILAFVFSTFAVIAFFLWYTIPVLAYTMFVKGEILALAPRSIDTLSDPPKEWDEIDIGGIQFRLPMSKCQKASGNEDLSQINFRFESCFISISDFVLIKDMELIYKEKDIEYPATSFQQTLKIANSVPSDISFFNGRSRNTEAATLQVLKGMKGQGVYDINVINHKIVKAICWKAVNKKGYQASVNLYNQSETSNLLLLIGHCRDKEELNGILSRTLGGITFPEKKLDSEEVRRDIKALIEKYKKEKA